ncbi:MAG: hypothetical protein HY012_01670 [Acidobacteria bacterium]|nr:hypothetical protein [Acidobacteriota bacterium]
MPDLLERAGFRLRGAKRADCAYCSGSSRGTVSFTEEVAYCHRCHWTANVVTLARQTGLPTVHTFPGKDAGLKPGPTNGTPNRTRPVGPPFRAASQPADVARLRREALLREFETWRQQRIRELSDLYNALYRGAQRAQEWTVRLREIGPADAAATCKECAWDAFERFYHTEHTLLAAIDFLTCAVGSQWLERDSTIVDVFRAWRRWLRKM